MTATESERDALTYYLRYQRQSVESILDGLDEAAWHTPVLPSRWTIAGMIQHLGDMEGHWAHIIDGEDVELPYDQGRPPYDPDAPFQTDRPAKQVLAFYREESMIFDRAFGRAPLSGRPVGRHDEHDAEFVPTVRWVALHVIEETAAHSGHLEVVRELLDGRTDLGLR